MQRETRRDSYGSGFGVVVALVETEPLGLRAGRPRAFHRDAYDGLGHELVVVSVCAVNREPDGNARAIGEEAALGSVLAAIRRIRPGLFPPREGPWSSPRPAKASSSRRPSHRRRPGVPGARTRGRRQRRATREICDTPTSRNKSPSRPMRSTGSRSGARRGLLPWHRGRGPADGDIKVDVTDAWAAVAPLGPTGHRSGSNFWRSMQLSSATTRQPNRQVCNFSTCSMCYCTFRSRPTEIGSKPKFPGRFGVSV